ncbi:MAG: hypothetical protein EBZ69_08790, partial [Alphaproteobacteria bacterium]|nr:hypothetical protein [Alphaproteobacteria bacterium]
IFLDYDPQLGKEALTAEEFVQILRMAMPELNQVTIGVKPSTSSCIYDGEIQISGIKGLHAFMVCSDASRIPEIGKLIYSRLWLAGYGYIRIAENGNLLERSIVDTAVWQPERFAFGGAVCKDRLEQRFPEPEIFPAKLELLCGGEQQINADDLRPLTPEETVNLARMIDDAREEKKLEAASRREKWIAKRAKEFVGKKATEEELKKCKESLRRALVEGDVLPDELILRCHDGSKVSVAQVRANPNEWHEKRFADPFEPGYGGNDTRIAVAYLKNCTEPLIFSHAHGGIKYYFRSKQERNDYIPDYVQEMNEKFMIVNEGGKVFVFRPYVDEAIKREVLERIKFDDFNRMYMNDYLPLPNGKEKPLSKSRAWLSHPKRRQYLGGVVFSPCKTVSADQFNLWRGWGVTPAHGSWDLIKNHILDVICSENKELFDYMMGWMARAVQHPDKPGEVAIILRGGRGTGKGTFAHL